MSQSNNEQPRAVHRRRCWVAVARVRSDIQKVFTHSHHHDHWHTDNIVEINIPTSKRVHTKPKRSPQDGVQKSHNEAHRSDYEARRVQDADGSPVNLLGPEA